MKKLLMLAVLLFPSFCFAGGIFGTLKKGADPAPAKTKIEVEIGDKKFEGLTDDAGRFNIAITVTGKAKITIETATLTVAVFQDPVQYNLVLDGGKLKLQQ